MALACILLPDWPTRRRSTYARSAGDERAISHRRSALQGQVGGATDEGARLAEQLFAELFGVDDPDPG
jgi:hypothetical protein